MVPGPQITSFTERPPNCTTNQINLHWTTQNAVGVDISIDGPGKYDSYGASGSAQVPFVCGGSHTYLLTAKAANGQTTQRKITVQSPPATTTSSSHHHDDLDQPSPRPTRRPQTCGVDRGLGRRCR